MFNKEAGSVYFDEQITTGNYRMEESSLERMDEKARWNKDADVMLQLLCSQNDPAKPNTKVCNIFLRSEGFNNRGELDEYTEKIIEKLRSKLKVV